MQRLKKKIVKIKDAITQNIKNKSKVKLIAILVLVILFIAFGIITLTTETIKQNRIKEMQELSKKPLLEYEIKGMIDKKNCHILVRITNADGIETVKYNVNDK